MIICFLSCSTTNNPTTNQQQMKELLIHNAEIQEIISTDHIDETHFILSFIYERKLRQAVFYYQQHSGIINENDMNKKCTVTLTKKSRELPRSVYPLLTQGYIVVQFIRFGIETYQVIKEFKKLEAAKRK